MPKEVKILTAVTATNSKGVHKHYVYGDVDTFDESELAKFEKLNVEVGDAPKTPKADAEKSK